MSNKRKRCRFTIGEQFIHDWQCKQLNPFYSHLASSIAAADQSQLNLLRFSFPDEVQAYINFSRTEGWWEALEEKVRTNG